MMRILTLVLAAALQAGGAAALDWSPAVSPETLSAVTVAAPSPAAAAGPRDGQNYSGAEELLIKEFSIAGIGMDIPEAEVMRQDREYNNAFCFDHALRLAVKAVLENYARPTSPLARELSAMGSLQAPSKSEVKKASRRVLEALNRRGSLVAVVRPFKFYQPLNGETLDLNWIFFLRVDGRPYWAVVDRSGETAPYVYGD
jgi:hypothetical protein